MTKPNLMWPALTAWDVTLCYSTGLDIGIGEAATDRVRRISRRSAEKMLCADFDKLTNEQKIEFNTHVSILGALAMVTRTDKVKQVKAAVAVANEKLPLASTLIAFK